MRIDNPTTLDFVFSCAALILILFLLFSCSMNHPGTPTKVKIGDISLPAKSTETVTVDSPTDSPGATLGIVVVPGNIDVATIDVIFSIVDSSGRYVVSRKKPQHPLRPTDVNGRSGYYLVHFVDIWHDHKDYYEPVIELADLSNRFAIEVDFQAESINQAESAGFEIFLSYRKSP